MISVHINGQAAELGESVDLAELVRARIEDDRGVAVAVNAEVVPRSDWGRTVVSAGDRIEIVRAVPGG